MRLDRAGHADRAEQQRDETDQVQEAIEIFERGAEIAFSFRDRVVFESEPLDLRRESFDSLLHVGAVGKLHVIAIARDAARLEQVCLLEIPERNVNARRERTRGGSFARNFSERARDSELQIADLDRIACLRVKLKEQAFVNNCARTCAKVARRSDRDCFHPAIKWKIAAQGANAHEPGAVALGKSRHGREANFARLRFA